jgi:hypothetical protein
MANVDITKIVQGGQDRVRVYSKQVDEAPTGAVAFEEGDVVAYLSEIGEVGASKETQEISLFHMKNKAKLPGSSTINDISVTEALTKDALDVKRQQYEDGSFIVVAFFDSEGNQLYGVLATISSWGMSLTDGDVCKLTYTLAPSDDKIEATCPTV